MGQRNGRTEVDWIRKNAQEQGQAGPKPQGGCTAEVRSQVVWGYDGAGVGIPEPKPNRSKEACSVVSVGSRPSLASQAPISVEWHGGPPRVHSEHRDRVRILLGMGTVEALSLKCLGGS